MVIKKYKNNKSDTHLAATILSNDDLRIVTPKKEATTVPYFFRELYMISSTKYQYDLDGGSEKVLAEEETNVVKKHNMLDIPQMMTNASFSTVSSTTNSITIRKQDITLHDNPVRQSIFDSPLNKEPLVNKQRSIYKRFIQYLFNNITGNNKKVTK